MDAKVSTVRTLVEASAEGSSWTPYQRLFERYIYTGSSASAGQNAQAETQEEEKGEDGGDKKGSLSLFR
jgi:hypothetical protein